MNIKEFGEILKQLNKVPIDYKDDAGIEMFMKRNYNEKKFDDGYYYNRNLVPIFSWNLSDDVRLRAIKDIDILRKREPYIFLTTFTSDSVPKYPIVICDKVIDNEELFAIRNDVEPKIFIEKFNKTSLHYFKIKIKDAKENNIGNDDVKTFNKNIEKLKDWFWRNDIDRDKTESFIDEVKDQMKEKNKIKLTHPEFDKHSKDKKQIHVVYQSIDGKPNSMRVLEPKDAIQKINNLNDFINRAGKLINKNTPKDSIILEELNHYQLERDRLLLGISNYETQTGNVLIKKVKRETKPKGRTTLTQKRYNLIFERYSTFKSKHISYTKKEIAKDLSRHSYYGYQYKWQTIYDIIMKRKWKK